MTSTLRVEISRSFESGIKNCRKVFTYDITTFRRNIHRKSTITYHIITGIINSKAMTLDLDLESGKKNWQEPSLKSTHENKHFGI